MTSVPTFEPSQAELPQRWTTDLRRDCESLAKIYNRRYSMALKSSQKLLLNFYRQSIFGARAPAVRPCASRAKMSTIANFKVPAVSNEPNVGTTYQWNSFKAGVNSQVLFQYVETLCQRLRRPRIPVRSSQGLPAELFHRSAPLCWGETGKNRYSQDMGAPGLLNTEENLGDLDTEESFSTHLNSRQLFQRHSQ